MTTCSSIISQETHRQRNLAGYSLWGRKERNMTGQQGTTLSAYKSYFYTILQFIKSAIALCLKNSMNTLIKKYFITEK